MDQPRVIREYLTVLSRQLPASIVEELADGLAETHQFYLRQGLAADAAARSAVTEFGEPHVILAEYARAHPAKRAASILLRSGPAIGGCWATALLTSRAWPAFFPARMLVGLGLVTVIGLLTSAALGTHYRLATRAGVAGCLGTVALDVLMITGAIIVTPTLTWIPAAAVAASTGRVTFSARTLSRLLVR